MEPLNLVNLLLFNNSDIVERQKRKKRTDVRDTLSNQLLNFWLSGVHKYRAKKGVEKRGQ